jgi:hypothetical protein
MTTLCYFHSQIIQTDIIKLHAETKNLQYVQDQRKRPPEKQKDELDEEEDEQKMREESGLERSGRLFGGLINDVKRKAPW